MAAGTNLVPYAEGDTISGIVVDPAAMTSEELADWIAIVGPEEINVMVETSDGTDDPGCVYVVEGTDGDPDWILIYYYNDENAQEETQIQKYIAFAPESFIYEGTTIPAGWSELVMEKAGDTETITATSITERTERTLFPRTTVIEHVQTKFEEINGTVIGVIKV